MNTFVLQYVIGQSYKLVNYEDDEELSEWTIYLSWLWLATVHACAQILPDSIQVYVLYQILSALPCYFYILAVYYRYLLNWHNFDVLF